MTSLGGQGTTNVVNINFVIIKIAQESFYYIEIAKEKLYYHLCNVRGSTNTQWNTSIFTETKNGWICQIKFDLQDQTQK